MLAETGHSLVPTFTGEGLFRPIPDMHNVGMVDWLLSSINSINSSMHHAVMNSRLNTGAPSLQKPDTAWYDRLLVMVTLASLPYTQCGHGRLTSAFISISASFA